MPATHISDLGDDLLREILARTGVLDRAVTARMVSRGWRIALAPPPEASAAVTGKGLCKDVDVTTEPRLLCRVRAVGEALSGVNLGSGGENAQIQRAQTRFFFFFFLPT